MWPYSQIPSKNLRGKWGRRLPSRGGYNGRRLGSAKFQFEDNSSLPSGAGYLPVMSDGTNGDLRLLSHNVFKGFVSILDYSCEGCLLGCQAGELCWTHFLSPWSSATKSVGLTGIEDSSQMPMQSVVELIL